MKRKRLLTACEQLVESFLGLIHQDQVVGLQIGKQLRHIHSTFSLTGSVVVILPSRVNISLLASAAGTTRLLCCPTRTFPVARRRCSSAKSSRIPNVGLSSSSSFRSSTLDSYYHTFPLCFCYCCCCWVPPDVYRSCTAGHHQHHHFQEQPDSCLLPLPDRNIFHFQRCNFTPRERVFSRKKSATENHLEKIGTKKNSYTQGTEKENNFCFLNSRPFVRAAHTTNTAAAAAPTFCLFSRCSPPSSILQPLIVTVLCLLCDSVLYLREPEAHLESPAVSQTVHSKPFSKLLAVHTFAGRTIFQGKYVETFHFTLPI